MQKRRVRAAVVLSLCVQFMGLGPPAPSIVAAFDPLSFEPSSTGPVWEHGRWGYNPNALSSKTAAGAEPLSLFSDELERADGFVVLNDRIGAAGTALARVPTPVREQAEQMLLRRITAWVSEDQRSGEFGDARDLIELSLEELELALLYTTDLDGTVVLDDLGDPVLKGAEDFAEASESWERAVEEQAQEIARNRQRRSATLMLEVFDAAARLGFDTAPHEMQIARFLALQSERRMHEQRVLVQQARNRFVAGRLRDTYSLRRKSERETAIAVRAELVGETAEELGVLTERLSESFRTAVDEHGTTDAAAIEALERGLQDALEEGIGRWAEAERELLLERARWEQEAVDAFSEGERSWQAVLEEFNRRRGEWFAQLSEIAAETELYWDHRVAEYRHESQASLAALEQASSFEVAQFVHELQQVTEMLELHRLELSIAKDRVSEFRGLVFETEQRYWYLSDTNPVAAWRLMAEELQPYRAELSFWNAAEAEYRMQIDELLLQMEVLEQEAGERGERYSLDMDSVEKRWIGRLLEEAEHAYESAEAILEYATDESSNRPTHSETKHEYENAAEELEHAYEEVQELRLELEELTAELGAGRELVQSHHEHLTELYQELTNRRREYEHALEMWSDFSLERLVARLDQRVSALIGFQYDDKARLYQAWIEAEEDVSRLELHERSNRLTELLRFGEAADPSGGDREMPALDTLRELKRQFSDFTAEGAVGVVFGNALAASTSTLPVSEYMGFEDELAVFSDILESLQSASGARLEAYRTALEASARNLSETLAAEILHREYAIRLLGENTSWEPERLQAERKALSEAHLSALRDDLAASLSDRTSIVEALIEFAESEHEDLEANGLAWILWNYRIAEHHAPYSLAELNDIKQELHTRAERIDELVTGEADLRSLLEGLWAPFKAYGVRLVPDRPNLDSHLSALALAAEAAALEQYAPHALATASTVRRESLEEVARLFLEYADTELGADDTGAVPEPSEEKLQELESHLEAVVMPAEGGGAGGVHPDGDDAFAEATGEFGLAALQIALELFLSAFREPEVVFDRGQDQFAVVDRRTAALSVLHRAYNYVSSAWEENVADEQGALDEAIRLAQFHERELQRAQATYTENREGKQRILEDLRSAGRRRAEYYRLTVAPARVAVLEAEQQHREALEEYRLALGELTGLGDSYAAKREVWESRVRDHRVAGFAYARARGVYEYASDGYLPAGFEPEALRDARYAEYRRLQRISSGVEDLLEGREDAFASVTDPVLLKIHERSYELAELQDTVEHLETLLFASINELRTERDMLAITYHDALSEVFRIDLTGAYATPGVGRDAPDLPDYRALSAEEMLEEEHASAYLANAQHLSDAEAFTASLLQLENPQRVLRDLGYAFYHEMQSVNEYEIDIDVVNDSALRSLIDERRIISGGGPRSQIRAFAAREAERGFNRVQADAAKARLYAVYRQLMLVDRFAIGERFIQSDLGGAVIDEARDEARKRIRRNRRRQRKFLAGFFVSRSSIIGAAILAAENRRLRSLRRSVAELSPEGEAQRDRIVADMHDIIETAVAYREIHTRLAAYLGESEDPESEGGRAIEFKEFAARFAELPGVEEYPDLDSALGSLSYEFGMLRDDDRSSFVDAVRALKARIHGLLEVNLAERSFRLHELSQERERARGALATAAADGVTQWEQLEPLATALFSEPVFSERGYQNLVQQVAGGSEAAEEERRPSASPFASAQRAGAAARLYRHVVELDLDQQSREFDLTHRRILDERARSIDRLHSLYETSAAAWIESERALRNDRDAWRRRYAREYELASESWELHWQHFQAERKDWLEQGVEHTVRSETERLAVVLGRRPEVLLQEVPIATETPSFRSGELAADSLQSVLGGLRLDTLLHQAVGTRDSIMLPANAFARHVRPESFAVTRLALQAESGIHEARRRLAAASALQLHALRREAREHMERAVRGAERDLSHQLGGTLESVGFRRRGQWYEREAISGSSLLGGTRYSTQRILDYRGFQIPDLGIRVALDPDRLQRLSPERLEEKAYRLRAELELHAEIVIGFRWSDLDPDRAGAVPPDWISLLRRETQALVREAAQRAAANEGFERAGAGLLGLHVGWAPAEQGNGYGELGRIFGDLREFEEERAEGLALIETPIWHQPIWDDSGGFVAAPSLQQVGSVAAGIGGALIGGPAGVALAAGTAATFGAADVIDGYQDLGEAGLQVGVATAGSAVGMGVGAAFSGATAAAGSVDGLWGVAAETAVGGARITTAHAAHSALGALEYDDGLFVSGDRIWSSLTSSEALALYASGVGAAAVESGLRLVNAAPSHTVGFSTTDLNRLNELNRAAGAVTGAGIEYALTGATGLSVLNLADLGLETEQRMGLASLNIGDRGVAVALGPGGHDLSIGRAASAAGGVALWHDNRRIVRYSDGLDRDLASALRAVRSYGDDAGQELFGRLLDGTDVVQFGLDDEAGGALAVTEQHQNGGRILRLANLGDSTSDALRYALLLQHEAHRDGIVDTENLLETREAVAAHTRMSAAIMQDERYGSGAFGLDSHLALQIALADMDVVALDAYSDAMFDSSGDYWRLMEDGSLEFDGDGWLRNPNGHYILDQAGNRIGAQGVQSGLQRILGISDVEAVRILHASGFTHLGGAPWWDHEGNEGLSITHDNAGYASLYAEKLDDYNPVTIYNRLVEYGAMDVKHSGYDTTVSVRGDWTGRLPDIEYITYEQYKAQNYITSPPEVWAAMPIPLAPRDEVLGKWGVTSPFGPRDYAGTSFHYGTDFRAVEGTDLRPMFPGFVPDGGLQLDENTPAGISITLQHETPEYYFMGMPRQDTFFTRYAHLSDSIDDQALSGNLLTSQVIAATGNTGRPLTGPHLHAELYTESQYKPLLDLMLDHSEQGRRYHYARNVWYYDLESFIDRTAFPIYYPLE